MVVLATAMIPHKDAPLLAQKLNVAYDKHGFMAEAHPKLQPVETSTGGIFIAGACNSPRDIPETVAMASAAASKALILFGSDILEREPIVAKVDESTCVACYYCIKVCPYNAIDRKEIKDRQERLSGKLPMLIRAYARVAEPVMPPVRQNLLNLSDSMMNRYLHKIFALNEA